MRRPNKFTYRPWTAEEDAQLVKLWPSSELSGPKIADALHRSYGATAQRAGKLGLSRPKERRRSPFQRLSPYDPECLDTLANSPTQAAAARALGVSPAAVCRFARNHPDVIVAGRDATSRPRRAGPWTSQERARLAELWPDPAFSGEQIAALLGRTVHAVGAHARRLGLQRPTRCQRWTAEEDAQLAELWSSSTLSVRQIADALQRSYAATAVRASVLGLNGAQRNRMFPFQRLSRYDAECLETLANAPTQSAAAEALGVSRQAVNAFSRNHPDVVVAGRTWKERKNND